MKIIFFGTPDYVIPVLEKLHKYYQITTVVTQPPKPVGREKKLEFSAVDGWAHKRKIEKHFDFDNLPKADMGVCASFGMIIPKNVINNFKYGILNIHPSLLPKYRGASPIQTTIANGDTITGVTVIKMDELMDHGKIVTQFKEEINLDDTFQSLRERLFEKSADVLLNLIEPYIQGKINLKEQDHKKVTFTKLVSKADGFVNLTDSPETIDRKLRAYSPWPGIWTIVTINGKEKRLKILEFKDEPITVQLEGKNPTNWKVFKNSYKFS